MYFEQADTSEINQALSKRSPCLSAVYIFADIVVLVLLGKFLVFFVLIGLAITFVRLALNLRVGNDLEVSVTSVK